MQEVKPTTTRTTVDEAARTYVYVNGAPSLTIRGVVDIEVRPSGAHKVRALDPLTKKVWLYYVQPDWSYIVIDPGAKDDWTV